ncbi:hypothetical protein NDA16_002779 [Ustilago loliicola]|nr:hypothetical protein NDA16_002779 [Ustilago loliicola]
MPPFSSSFGRLPNIRKRETKKKSVQPIDVDAAKQYEDAGPSSAASSSLLTPRPHHYRSTTPSPATPAASSFAPISGSSSTRFVSSPTFVSSSALAAGSSFSGDLGSLTPPLSPVAPHSAIAAQATKSPIRRALSRTFFFGSSTNSHSNASNNIHSSTPQISSPIPVAWDVNQPRAPRPARPARPVTSPATGLSPQPNAFGFTAAPMTRSQTSCPTFTTTPIEQVITHTRSCTLMPPATIPESQNHRLSKADGSKLSSSQRSASPTWSMRFSRSASPLPISQGDSSAPLAASPSSPRSSLRSIRQMHARKSIHSIFGLSTSAGAESTTMPQDTPVAHISSTRRLTRRASEESFHCRGPGFDGPPAADTSQFHTLGFYTRPTAGSRSVSMYSSSNPSTSYGMSGARRMSHFTRFSYEESSKLDKAAYDMLSEVETETETETALAGLGLVDPLPAAPRFMPKRLSATSQISLAESVPSSVHSSFSSTVSLSSSVNQQLNSSWPDIPSMQTWFSACPPTPPSSIRLQLEFRSLPPCSPAALFSATVALTTTDADEVDKKPARPLSGIFISSNSSVLDLKETIASRMCDLGYRLSPKNLTLTLHLNEDVRTNSRTALGLKLSAYGKNPAKVLDDSSRLLFEEGAQEEDLVVVDCDPSHILWSI